MDVSSQRKGRLRQLIRCHQILERLASHRIGYNANLLAEELGSTTKTIYRDLRALKEVGVPIEYDSRRKRYRLGTHPLIHAYLQIRGDNSSASPAGTSVGSRIAGVTITSNPNGGGTNESAGDRSGG